MFNPIKWLLTKSEPKPKEETVSEPVNDTPVTAQVAATDANTVAVQAAVDKPNPVYYAGEDVERIFDVAKYAADKLGIEFFAPVIQHLKSLVKPVTPE